MFWLKSYLESREQFYSGYIAATWRKQKHPRISLDFFKSYSALRNLKFASSYFRNSHIQFFWSSRLHFTMLRIQPKSLKKYKAQLGVDTENLEFCKNQTVDITTKSLHISSPDQPKNQLSLIHYHVADLRKTTSSLESSKSSFQVTNLFGCKKQKYSEEHSEVLVQSGTIFDLHAESTVRS